VAYHLRLFDKGFVDPAESVRMAYRLKRARGATENPYVAVIVDELQGLSEIGLRLLHSRTGDRRDGLLLVGDATQRIFTRGFHRGASALTFSSPDSQAGRLEALAALAAHTRPASAQDAPGRANATGEADS